MTEVRNHLGVSTFSDKLSFRECRCGQSDCYRLMSGADMVAEAVCFPHAEAIVTAVNSHASLLAERDDLQERVTQWHDRCLMAEQQLDCLESNARVQAKLLADTGRENAALKAALIEIADMATDTRLVNRLGEIEKCANAVLAGKDAPASISSGNSKTEAT